MTALMAERIRNALVPCGGSTGAVALIRVDAIAKGAG
jgi:hypothetical protein